MFVYIHVMFYQLSCYEKGKKAANLIQYMLLINLLIKCSSMTQKLCFGLIVQLVPTAIIIKIN